MSKILVYANSDPYTSAEMFQQDPFDTYDAIIALEGTNRVEQKDGFKFIDEVKEFYLPEVVKVAATTFIEPIKCDILICGSIDDGTTYEDKHLEFDVNKILFLEENPCRFVFTNAYNRLFELPLENSTFISLPPLKEGYVVLDTKDWSFEFVKR